MVVDTLSHYLAAMRVYAASLIAVVTATLLPVVFLPAAVSFAGVSKQVQVGSA